MIGEFYGNPPNETANLDLVARFFEKYPGYADKAFLSVKVQHILSASRISIEESHRAVQSKERSLLTARE